MQKWYEWLEHMKKKDEKGKMEEMHQRRQVEQMNKGAEGSAGFLHKITKPTLWRGGVQILKSIGNVTGKFRICPTSHGGMRN